MIRSAPAPVGAGRAWWLLVLVCGGIALLAVTRWLWALAQHAPVLYGEGAVAHAAVLARDRLEYGPYPPDAIFVAANYPPLYFHLAGMADPFVAGRLLSIACTLFVAGAIGYRARPAGVLVALALAASWLATAPVAVWGAAVKPDLVALALTVGAVLALDGPRRPLLAGVLIALAIWAKPTAGFPALALAIFLVATERRAAMRFVGAAFASLVVAALATHVPDAAMLEHVVTWNALDWHADQALLLAFLALLLAGVSLVALGVLRPRGAVGAYALGAVAIVALGGREGATINYLLDLFAAAWLAMAGAAPRMRGSWPFPIGVALQTLVAIALLDPLGVFPGRAIGTGAWEPAGRIDVVHAIGGTLLVEDAGLQVADGRAPPVDDIFLWSRLQDRRRDDRLVAAVHDGAFAAIVSESDLAHLDAAPLFERQRWDATLVAAVLARYQLDRAEHGLYVYRPR